MARYQFDVEPEDGESRRDRLEARLHLGTKIAGCVLLLFGTWLIVAVVIETWGLFQHPQRIELLATAIERGSNLDRALAPHLAPDTATPAEAAAPPFRLAYFAAWIIALLLLLVLGQLSVAAIRAGGALACSDAAVKRLLKELIGELRRP
jgi:hypothetical protein